MNTRNQLIITHSCIPMMLIVFIGSFVLTGWLPPPSPNTSLEDLAKMFSPDHIFLRIGVMLMCIFSTLLIAFSSVIATQLKRIEGEHHVLANAQFVAQAAGLCLFLCPGYLWMALSYRPGIDPQLIMVLNDFAWFMFLAGAGPTFVQWVCIAIAILGDKSAEPIYPRWLAWLNIWLAVGIVPAQILMFVKSGPFAYNGLFGFWIVAFAFFTWNSTIWWCTFKAVKKQALAVSG